MIYISNKSKCSGCEACKNICPKNAISMEEDEEGFRYPKLDKNLCINCGLCNKVCPLSNCDDLSKFKKYPYLYAAYNKDLNILFESSSGGIFSALAKSVVINNGIIYGVCKNNVGEIVFTEVKSMKDCDNLRGSKYLQAMVNNIYRSVLKQLKLNKMVLFSGTPCQIAGLYKFLGKDFENLYTCDVVCHGVPSNLVFKKYVEYLQLKYRKKVSDIKFRTKKYGWNPNKLKIIFEDGTELFVNSQDSIFQKGFLKNYFLRPSCYSCKFAKIPRVADISLADFWGYDGKLKNDNMGISLVVVSSEKGKKIFESIKNNIDYELVSLDYAKKRSRHLYLPPAENYDRDKFFSELLKGKDFESLANKYYMNPSLFMKIKKKIKYIICNQVGNHEKK